MEDKIEPTAPPMEPSETEVNSVNKCISELSEHLNESISTPSITKVEQSETVDPSSFVTVIEVNGQKPLEASAPSPSPLRKIPPK